MTTTPAITGAPAEEETVVAGAIVRQTTWTTRAITSAAGAPVATAAGLARHGTMMTMTTVAVAADAEVAGGTVTMTAAHRAANLPTTALVPAGLRATRRLVASAAPLQSCRRSNERCAVSLSRSL